MNWPDRRKRTFATLWHRPDTLFSPTRPFSSRLIRLFVHDDEPLPSKFFRERPDRLANIRLAVLARHEEPQACEFLGHRGIEDRLNVDAALEQRGGHARGAHRAADDGGYYREARTGSRVDARFARELQKQRTALA